ncbi:GDP-fucose protein O-fucosyltransferase protein [Actinidia chinensis var. chinensis]|uniref:O-fucosyltransferase family protein n=1 Tax=Actinidia chinensis var. chinensis TaxID=1590841 RepID=A0A2R6RNK4_ACTCC|nr:GDP-fucose protein O-fucosyltransferase protein [Actinidia chinensis var. chinensis]
MQRLRWRTLGLLRRLLSCAIGSIGLVAVLYAHVRLFPSSPVPKLPDSYKLPMHQEIGLGGEQSWMLEVAPPHLSRAPLPARKICDMVAVAHIINATLVIPELDKRSFWQDTSNFSDVFDDNHFISSLANDVKVIKKLPKELATSTRAVKHFRSWSGIEYYQDEIASMWEDYQVIRAAKSDSRLANNNLPPDIQKLRCRACYEALRFSPHIEAMGKWLVDRMRSYGPYIALHLRYEKDMLAFSGCTHDLSPEEADELKTIRENTVYWKVKDIDSTEQRAKGYCPLTPKEVGIFLTALGFPSSTPIYIAAGEIYGGDSRMANLQSRYPLLMNKEKLASAEELGPFINHASQMAALDYIVSVESDIFIPSFSGNMARAVEGHRRFLGHRKTISPDRKALVHLFDKLEQGTLKEGKKLSARIIEIHKRRQGSPRKRKGPISGTKGMDSSRSCCCHCCSSRSQNVHIS